MSIATNHKDDKLTPSSGTLDVIGVLKVNNVEVGASPAATTDFTQTFLLMGA